MINVLGTSLLRQSKDSQHSLHTRTHRSCTRFRKNGVFCETPADARAPARSLRVMTRVIDAQETRPVLCNLYFLQCHWIFTEPRASADCWGNLFSWRMMMITLFIDKIEDKMWCKMWSRPWQINSDQIENKKYNDVRQMCNVLDFDEREIQV